MIVGWSTAPRGQVIEECLGQLPKKLAAARACWQGLNHHTPIRDETGWTTRRSLGEVGTNSAHSKPVCLCGDCTFLDEIHRAGLEKKSHLERAVHNRSFDRGDPVFHRPLHLLERAHLDLAHALARDAEFGRQVPEDDRIIRQPARLENAPLAR